MLARTRRFVVVFVAIVTATCFLAGGAIGGAPTGAPATPSGGADDAPLSMASGTNLSLSDAIVEPGDTAVVTVTATDELVAGYETVLTYDPAVLDLATVEGEDIDLGAVNDSPNGSVSVTGAAEGNVEDPVLATLVFDVVTDEPDTTTVAFDTGETALNDEDSYVAIDGYEDGTVNVTGDAPTGNVTLSSASGETGDVVTIAVGADGTDVAGYEAAIDYADEALALEAASGGDVTLGAVADENGTVTLTGAEDDGLEDPLLAELTFEILAEDDQEIDLEVLEDETVLNDDEERYLAIEAYDGGSVTVLASDDEQAPPPPDDGAEDEDDESESDEDIDDGDTQGDESANDVDDDGGETNRSPSTGPADSADVGEPADDEADDDIDAVDHGLLGIPSGILGTVALVVVGLLAGLYVMRPKRPKRSKRPK